RFEGPSEARKDGLAVRREREPIHVSGGAQDFLEGCASIRGTQKDIVGGTRYPNPDDIRLRWVDGRKVGSVCHRGGWSWQTGERGTIIVGSPKLTLIGAISAGRHQTQIKSGRLGACAVHGQRMEVGGKLGGEFLERLSGIAGDMQLRQRRASI